MRSPCYLFGPVTAAFADEYLRGPRQAGQCLTFGFDGGTELTISAADSWETLRQRFPSGWQPDFIALHFGQALIPRFLWSAPVPLVALATDWNLGWHSYRRWLPRCHLVLTDTVGVEAFARAGIRHARLAPLNGWGRSFQEKTPTESVRDIDVLSVDDFHPAADRERLPWLGRLARFGERRRVAILTNVDGDDYRDLLWRSRIVFTRSLRGECNPQVFEAAAAGALVFQEAENLEVPTFFRDQKECVYYNAENLELLLDHYLEHEDERCTLAEAAKERLPNFSFDNQWQEAIGGIEREWPEILQRFHERLASSTDEELLARCWQALGSHPHGDLTLLGDLQEALANHPPSAALHNALGLAELLIRPSQGSIPSHQAERAVQHFHQAVESDPLHLVARLNLVEALLRIQQVEQAIQQARRVLYLLDRLPLDELHGLDEVPFTPALDFFRVEWERAAWINAGLPAAEAQTKRDLLRWRLHTLLGEWTDDLNHRYEAVLARPDLPATRAALGCALARSGRPDIAIDHLAYAVTMSPFDRSAARALFHALGEIGEIKGQRLMAHERRLLARAAPQVVPSEDWFSQEPAALSNPPKAESEGPPKQDFQASRIQDTPSAKMRVSLCMMVKNEEAYLPGCLDSVQDLVDEIVIVDTGSTDKTRDVAAHHGARVIDFPWVDSFSAARNESLRHATGQWIFWLDADDRLDDQNRQTLKTLFASLKDENAAYVMKCVCLPDLDSQAATIVDHVRLFRNHPELRWQYRVHEQILPSLRRLGHEVRWSEVSIHHVGYQDEVLRHQKLERDLRLVRMENNERPEDPFILFNLGSIYQELNHPAEAIPCLRRSLERSHPGDSIVRKLHALLVQCHRQLSKSAKVF